MKILIIEDEKVINDNITTILTHHRYAVDQAFDGKEGLFKASVHDYDAIICDVNLPFLTGFEIVDQLRTKGVKTPVLFLTARDGIENLSKGFNAGGDDYLTKPFEMKELLLRINALIRRSASSPQSSIMIGEIEVRPETKEVFRLGVLTKLTAKEYGIIEYLGLNRGKYVTQNELIEHIWSESEAEEFSASVRTHIKNLRKKLGNIIETEKGKGYRISQ